MATNEIEVKPEGQKRELKRLGFVRIAAIQTYVFVSSFYESAKKHSGPLRSAVETVEGTATTVLGPVYNKFKGVPDDVLLFVDNKFCLSFDGQKLVTEEDHLKNFGIMDGDQLRFIRHASNNCGVRVKRSKRRVVHLKQHRRSSRVNYCKLKEHCEDDDIGSDEEAIENAKSEHCNAEERVVGKNKFTGFVGELLYTPLAIVRKTRSTSRLFPSTFSRCLLGSFRKIRRIVSFGRRQHYPIPTWRLRE